MSKYKFHLARSQTLVAAKESPLLHPDIRTIRLRKAARLRTQQDPLRSFLKDLKKWLALDLHAY